MKTTLLAFTCFSILAVSCSESTDKNEEKDQQFETHADTVEVVSLDKSHFFSVEKWDSLNYEGDYYITNFKGADTEENAIKMVDSLLPEFPKAGYLWIPDFASLSDKELFVVFLDQSKYDFSAMEFMQKHKTEIPDIYLVKVNQSKDRWVAYSPIDVRINGEKQKMILTYATPEDSEEYANEGGEDWGWFVNDVGEYFRNNYPEIAMESVFYSGLLPSEIEGLQKELDLDGFCYIFIDGNNKKVVGHDMPDYVITEACSFFGFPEPDFGY